MDYSPEYDEIVSRARVISDTVDWLKDLSEKLANDGLMGYSLSCQSWAKKIERMI